MTAILNDTHYFLMLEKTFFVENAESTRKLPNKG